MSKAVKRKIHTTTVKPAVVY